MLGFGSKKKATGLDLLDQVAEQFVTMSEDLLTATSQCYEQIKGVQAQMDVLRTEEASLTNGQHRADRFRQKLEELIS